MTKKIQWQKIKTDTLKEKFIKIQRQKKEKWQQKNQQQTKRKMKKKM